MRYSIQLSYNGADFCGWQVQPDAPSVQETLSHALSLLLRGTISVTGAGRTDSKVNAVGYIGHFDTSGSIDAEKTACKLNAMLPPSIVVHSISEAGEDFHARFGATKRSYCYFLHRRKDPFMGSFSYFCTFRLDVDAMNRAAALMLGTHDFSCFEKTGADNKTSVCTVTEAVWESYTPSHVSQMGFPCEEGDYLVFRISADRFLRNMVRATVGSLIDVGRGKRDISYFQQLIEGGSRSDAGESVPGNALFLSEVKY